MLNAQNSAQYISQLSEFETMAYPHGGGPEIEFHAKTDAIEFCYYINKIAAAVTIGNVPPGSDVVPKPFATADVFEKFLSEMNSHYKHSVDQWGHVFGKVAVAAHEIRQAKAFLSSPQTQ